LPSFNEIMPPVNDISYEHFTPSGGHFLVDYPITVASPANMVYPSILGSGGNMSMGFSGVGGFSVVKPPLGSELYGFGGGIFKGPRILGGVLPSSPMLGDNKYDDMSLDMSNKRKLDEVTSLSNKKGKKHDSTPVEEYVNLAIKLNRYPITGIVYFPNKFIILNEDQFYAWVRSIKAPEYALSKSSLLEKFDKSRRTNRVNPRENSGKIAIKYLRIDKVSRSGPPIGNIKELEHDLELIQRQYGANHIRVITHRDWGYIDKEYFYYEVPTKKT